MTRHPTAAVELDPAELWDSVVDAGRRRSPAPGIPRLAAIGLANQGETVVAWDRATGAAHGPAIVWQDRRSAGRLRASGRAMRSRLAEHTGLELDPYFVAPKIVWLREQIGDRA